MEQSRNTPPYLLRLNPMPLQPHLKHLIEGRATLSREEARDLMQQILAGHLSDIEIAALLGALAARGETPAEVAGFVDTMRSAATHLPLSPAAPAAQRPPANPPRPSDSAEPPKIQSARSSASTRSPSPAPPTPPRSAAAPAFQVKAPSRPSPPKTPASPAPPSKPLSEATPK